MPLALVRLLVFVAAFVLFVPVRWHVWGGRLREYRWRFLKASFGQMVDAERAHLAASLITWTVILGLLTWIST